MKFINHQKVVSFCGYSFFKVISGSMYPEITEGSNIITKKCKDYEVGDIITFYNNDEIITHRINYIDNNLYYTKGDYNNSIDLEPIEYDQIYGKVICKFNLFIPFFNNSLSKYIDSKKISIDNQIANPIFIVDGEREIYINKYNQINEYNFSVRNFENTKVSDVDLEYNIKIIADKDVYYKLYSNDKIISTDDYLVLENSKMQKDEYILYIEVPEDYEGILKINIYAFQKKE